MLFRETCADFFLKDKAVVWGVSVLQKKTMTTLHRRVLLARREVHFTLIGLAASLPLAELSSKSFALRYPAFPTNVRRSREPAAPSLPKTLSKWLFKKNNNGVLLWGEVIKIKAPNVLNQENIHLSKLNNCSWRFKMDFRSAVKSTKISVLMNGEAQNAATHAIRMETTRIRKIGITFTEKVLWNPDEFSSLFWCPPSLRACKRSCIGYKN